MIGHNHNTSYTLSLIGGVNHVNSYSLSLKSTNDEIMHNDEYTLQKPPTSTLSVYVALKILIAKASKLATG